MPLAFCGVSEDAFLRVADSNPGPLIPDGSGEASGKLGKGSFESLLGQLDPGELFARGMQTVNFTGGAGAWKPPTLEELRIALPQFEITEFVGSGGMGAVYRGVQRALEREVAIKVLRPELTMEEVALRNFMNEARITAQLDHPNIPAVYVLESDQAQFLSAFAMNLNEGQTM